MPHYTPESFTDNLNMVNRIIYQNKRSKFKPLKPATIDSIIENLQRPAEEIGILKMILKSKKEDLETLKKEISEIISKE